MNKKKKISLFGDDDPEEDQSNGGLGFNKGYAERYDNWRRLEEMQKIKDKYGDDDDDSSSESEAEWGEDAEEGFLRTLGALKSGDLSGFKDGKGFFKEVGESSDGEKTKKETKKDKKMTIRDYNRKVMLEKGGHYTEEDDKRYKDEQPQAYWQEQEKLKKNLADAFNFEEDDEEEIFTERQKTKKELDDEDADFYEWMKSEDGKADKKKAKELKHLKKFWKDDEQKLDDSEKFLRDYILNKDYEPGEKEENPTYEDIVALEQDEKDLDKNRQYEHKYNFRFEDPDQEFIKQYPRTVAESMRTEDSSRKDKRHEREERKKKEKEEKKRELAELKKMKRSEIEQKLVKLQKAAGVNIPLTLDELNADFDPKEFDKKMSSIFNDEYYGVEENVQEDDDEKPVFSDMDDSDYEDYDNLDVEQLKKEGVEEEDEEEESDEEEEEQQEKAQTSSSSMKNGKFDMAAAAMKAMSKDKNESRRKGKRNALKEALAKKKPLFNPKEKTFEDYFNEYYALDYEDIIGDTPTRFKYRQVAPNSFGLSTEEILEADERQLNAWASLQKVVGYRTSQEEFFDQKAYRRKAEDVEKKNRILNTDFGGKKSLKRKAEDEAMAKALLEEEAEDVEAEGEKKKKKKKRAKKNTADKKAKLAEKEKQSEVEEDVEEEPEAPEAPEESEIREEEPEDVVQEKNGDSSAPPPKKKARKRSKNKNTAIAEKFGEGMTDSRVKAYGLNPSRLKKGLFYGK
ncbi:hypothetical protein L5515_013527 [Caenorhabditis briggsae]|uniref:Protein KRI1 homolog n=1 Tax=Caenorhabditis briggsae TaxID=6238 RepID=A0AAE9J6S3_CAEBR|nr:hypothetical protein L5515_013527 [Caenorhabditis briggsae]